MSAHLVALDALLESDDPAAALAELVVEAGRRGIDLAPLLSLSFAGPWEVRSGPVGIDLDGPVEEYLARLTLVHPRALAEVTGTEPGRIEAWIWLEGHGNERAGFASIDEARAWCDERLRAAGWILL